MSVVTLKGKTYEVTGGDLKLGDPAPAFTAWQGLGERFDSVALGGKVRFFNVVASLDIGICDAQTKRFSEEAIRHSGVEWVTLSTDTPMAQVRWSGATHVSNMRLLSDYIAHDFGLKHGVYIPELGLLQRAIIIVDQTNSVRYIERVPEITQHPDYDEALAALKKVLA